MNTFTTEPNPKQVLIVEDELIVAMDLANNLEKLGYTVSGQARTADQAIRKVAESRPDLVLMDIQLTGSTDGVTAARTIRERWNIPVVFVTANTNGEVIARAKAAGPYGFLSKPFRPRELDATVSIALNQHRLARALFDQRSWLTTLLASISDGVIASDAEGIVQHMNPAAELITGWSAPDAIGLPIERVYPLSSMEGDPIEQCQLRKALTLRQPVGKQRFLLDVKSDGQCPVEDSASPIVESGQILGAVTIFLDISERVEKERYELQQRERLEEQVQISSAALGNTRQELQELLHHLMNAQEAERARIARELHDDLGQRTALLGMKLDKLWSQIPTGIDSEMLSLRKDVTDLAKGLREVSHQLHPSIIVDLGLVPALESLVNDYLSQGLSVRWSFDVLPQLTDEVATALYRIAQEALSNAKKHAPNSPVTVRLWHENGNVHLSIRDAGLGFFLADVRRKGGIGLITMQERARLAGGTLLLSADPGEGTTVLARVPLRN